MSNHSSLPAIGWMCSYTPLELITAGGLQPIRISADGAAAPVADGYMDPNCCPYVKAMIGMGVQKNLRRLDGLVVVNSCDSMRRLYDIWKVHIPIPFLTFLEVPKRRDEEAVDYFTSQLEKLLQQMEEHFRITIDTESLSSSINELNRQRSDFLQVQEQMNNNSSSIKGSDLWKLAELILSGRKKDFDQLCKMYLKRPLPSSSQTSSSEPRLLISGNLIDQPTLFELIEKLEGKVVAQDTCTGLRHFSGLVEENGSNPLRAIAARYLHKPPCPRMSALDERAGILETTIDEMGIDGVIFSMVKFCDHHLYTVPFLQERLEKRGCPALIIENDYTWQNLGQIKTRIQAFIEMIRGKMQ